ncbi:hypothetical protein [Streptomyces sp. NPDC056683]|uniref:hypothetical protein n=1 Tax=Streptomyces sp. NPDC056683 TaxID=3345910 RepID=UPI00368D1B50
MDRTLYLLVHRHHFADEPGAPTTVDFMEDGEPLFWDDSEDSFTLLGLYSSQQRAEQRIEQARTLPGFRDHPNGFHVHQYTVGQTHWAEGFLVGEQTNG